jgi:hypothetical protein
VTPQEPQELTTAERKPRRKKSNALVTLEMDQNLFNLALAHANGRCLGIDDVIEDALFKWLLGANPFPHLATTEGRFLWNYIPLDLHRLTLRFWAYVFEEWTGDEAESLEMNRKHIEFMLQQHMPPERLLSRLQRMTAIYRRGDQGEPEEPAPALEGLS